MTVQSAIILRLIAMIPDDALREQIKAQYYQDMEAQTSFVQVRIGQLELDLKDQVQSALGSTNEMVSELLAIGRRQEGALTEVRREFQSIGEKLDQHEAEMASFRASRDRSIQERADLRADLAESKADRRAIHKELEIASDERQRIMTILGSIEKQQIALSDFQELVEMINRVILRLDRLERNEQRSNER